MPDVNGGTLSSRTLANFCLATSKKRFRRGYSGGIRKLNCNNALPCGATIESIFALFTRDFTPANDILIVDFGRNPQARVEVR